VAVAKGQKIAGQLGAAGSFNSIEIATMPTPLLIKPAMPHHNIQLVNHFGNLLGAGGVVFGGSGKVRAFVLRWGDSDCNFNEGGCDNNSPDSGLGLFGNEEPADEAEFAALGNLERSPWANFPIDQFSGIPGSLIVCPQIVLPI
jgi:hypothetical protein